MTIESWTKFKNALDTVGIAKYQIDTETDYHLFNDTDAGKVIVLDEGTNTFYNFRARVGNAADGWKDPIIVTGVEIDAVKHVKFGAKPDKIREFIDAMGLTLTEEQENAIVKIDKGNYDINPITGDYLLAGFKVLTPEEVAELSPQEKIDYEKRLELYNQRQKFGRNQVIHVDIG